MKKKIKNKNKNKNKNKLFLNKTINVILDNYEFNFKVPKYKINYYLLFYFV